MLLVVAVGVRGNNLSSHLRIFRPDRVCISNCCWLLIVQGDFLRFFGLRAALGRHVSSVFAMPLIMPPSSLPGSEEDWLTSVFPPGFSPHSSSLGLYPESVLEIRGVCMQVVEEFCFGKELQSF